MEKNYFSLDGWMKYIASMDGNGCLLLYMSSTTAGKIENLRTSEQRNQQIFS